MGTKLFLTAFFFWGAVAQATDPTAEVTVEMGKNIGDYDRDTKKLTLTDPDFPFNERGWITKSSLLKSGRVTGTAVYTWPTWNEQMSFEADGTHISVRAVNMVPHMIMDFWPVPRPTITNPFADIECKFDGGSPFIVEDNAVTEKCPNHDGCTVTVSGWDRGIAISVKPFEKNDYGAFEYKGYESTYMKVSFGFYKKEVETVTCELKQ